MNPPQPDEAPPSYDAAISGGYTNVSYQQQGPPMTGGTYPPHPPYPEVPPNPPYPQQYGPPGDQGAAYPPVTNPPYVADGNQTSLLTTPPPPAYEGIKETISGSQESIPVEETNNDTNSGDDDDEKSPGGASLCFLVFVAIPIAMVVVGFQNLDKCPWDDTIPIYFILSGASVIVVAFLIACTIACKLPSSCETTCFIIAGLLSIAHFGLQIWGSYLVFKKYSTFKTVKDIVDRSGGNMDLICNPTLFLFAFGMLIIYWIIVPCIYSGSKAK